jgi:hypothetical protein
VNLNATFEFDLADAQHERVRTDGGIPDLVAPPDLVATPDLVARSVGPSSRIMLVVEFTFRFTSRSKST